MGAYDFDLIVIGGGPGGYVAAIRAAQLGGKVCLMERERMGGTCLNSGCIPTKALHRSAQVYHLARNSGEFGIVNTGVSVNWEQVQERKNRIVDQLASGVDQLMKGNGITVIRGAASLLDANRVAVKKEDGETEAFTGRNLIIATGSGPWAPPLEGAALPGVMDSTGLLFIDHIPSELTIVGGGVIGMEFAAVFSTLGSQVTVVELLPEILSQLDGDLKKRLRPMLNKRGIKVLTEARVSKIQQEDGRLLLTASTVKGEVQIPSEVVLLAVGRRPLTDEINLSNAGVLYDKKGITVNGCGQTNIPHIYAVGDVTGGMMLAHTASHQGITAAEHMMGLSPRENSAEAPGCVFTFPEIAFAGITEEEARARGISLKVGKYLFGANGKALTLGEGEGLLKVISDQEGRILGVHILGPHASDLIHEGALAIGVKASADEITETIHAHPTLSEAFAEAVMDLDGRALHAAPRAKPTK